jgi:hypothetical protein
LAHKGKSKMPSYWLSPEIPLSEKLSLTMVGIVVSYTTWAGVNPGRAGYVTVALSLLTLGLLLACDRIDRHEGLVRSTRRRQLMLRDPLCGFAFFFILYLVLQWVNGMLTSRQAPVSWVPTAMDAGGAWELLASFLPVVAIFLAIRHGLHTHRSLWAVLSLSALIGTMAALFGIVQHLLAADRMFWVIPVDGPFFAGFSEPEHAATYCIVALCISLSFCASDWRLLHAVERSLGGHFYVTLTSTAICMAAVLMTRSRIGPVFAWFVLLLAAGQATLGRWGAMTPVHRLYAAILLAWVIAVACFTTIEITPDRVRMWRMEIPDGESGAAPDAETLSRLHLDASQLWAPTGDADSALDLATHALLCQDTFRLWRERAVFGTGGGGFDALRGTGGAGAPGARRTAGTMRVHCDPLEFLLELGGVGMVLLIGMVAMAGTRIHGGGLWRDPFFLFGLLGLGWTLLSSLFGTPFRHPGILSLSAVAWMTFSRLVALEKR